MHTIPISICAIVETGLKSTRTNYISFFINKYEFSNSVLYVCDIESGWVSNG